EKNSRSEAFRRVSAMAPFLGQPVYIECTSRVQALTARDPGECSTPASDREVLPLSRSKLLEVLAAHVRREEADEFHHVVAQVCAALVGEARGLRREEVRAVERLESLVLPLAEGARRDDPDAEPEAHVRLDHVGIER